MIGKKENWGGRREGAGRPKSEATKKQMSLTIDSDLVTYVEEQENKSKFVNDCIRFRLKNK